MSPKIQRTLTYSNANQEHAHVVYQPLVNTGCNRRYLSMSSAHHHLLLISIPGWGHMKPALAYAIKLLQETSHLTITYPISSIMVKQIDDEINQYISDTESPVRKRLRIVPFGEIVLRPELVFPTFFKGLFPFCQDLFTSTPYQQANGITLSSIQQPDICLFDIGFWDLICFIRNIYPQKIPILTISVANTTCTIFNSGPEELGGKGDVPTKAELLVRETGKSIDDIYIELYTPNKGQVTNLIGLPKVYDYECHIKSSPSMRSVLTQMYPKFYKQYLNCDGVVTTSTRIFEQESNDAFKAYYENTGRSYYVVGPRALTADQLPKERSTDRDAVEKFLDRILQKHGQRSLVYVSFGSFVWPSNPEATWKVFEVLHEMQIPMILVHDEARPPIPDALHPKLEASDIVLISKWAPQNFVLNHMATAWFLTACGQNSVLEALSHGIPMIAWPVQADQCFNSIYIGELKHNVGYEMLEVQHRDETQPLYRGYVPSGTLDAIEKEFRTILTKAFGPDGAEKRQNAEIFKEKISHLWDEDGEARLEMRKFIKDYLS